MGYKTGSFSVVGDTCTAHNWNWATYTSGSGLRECQNDDCTAKAGIGDTGPAGGIIFYAKDEEGFTVTGSGSFDANYLEASTVNQGTALAWASSGYTITGIAGTGTAIGTGKANTAAIFAIDTNAPAALACKNYDGGDKDDWFLPSKDELNELCKHRSHFGISTGNFLSSSQCFATNAWGQIFANGSQGSHYNKYYGYNVRAVRAF